MGQRGESMERMKIVFFTPSFNMGGYEKVVLEFANYLAKNTNNRIIIACCNETGELKQLVDVRIKIFDFNCKTRTLIFKFIRLIKQEKPNVIYTGFRIYNTIAVLAKWLSGYKKVKICISQHGYETNGKLFKTIYSAILRRADLFIGVTENLRRYEVAQLNLTCQSAVVGNPVIKKEKLNHVENKKGTDAKSYKIVTCGRLSYDKNYSLAINITKEVLDRGYSVELLILGDGPERASLEKQAKQLGIYDRINFLGYVTNPIDYMQGCTVYLHTCDREGFGNTVVEALYVGIPVVTTDCGGPVDIIEENTYGISFGNGRDAQAAERGAEAIIAILDKKQTFVNLRERALLYSVDSVAPKLLKFMMGERSDD